MKINTILFFTLFLLLTPGVIQAEPELDYSLHMFSNGVRALVPAGWRVEERPLEYNGLPSLKHERLHVKT